MVHQEVFRSQRCLQKRQDVDYHVDPVMQSCLLVNLLDLHAVAVLNDILPMNIFSTLVIEYLLLQLVTFHGRLKLRSKRDIYFPIIYNKATQLSRRV